MIHTNGYTLYLKIVHVNIAVIYLISVAGTEKILLLGIIIEALLEKKDVVGESTLFTRQEQQYLDYMLNVQQFNNGPELRNKYVHGTFSLSPDVHNNDYIELLKIMTLIVIKINEEFCLKYPLE